MKEQMVNLFKTPKFSVSVPLENIHELKQDPGFNNLMDLFVNQPLSDLKWIESRVQELNEVARNTKNLDELSLTAVNVEHFINDLIGLKVTISRNKGFMGIPMEIAIQKIVFCLQELKGIKKLIKERRKFLSSKPINPKVGTKQLTLEKIALICVYNEEPITNINYLKVAERFGRSGSRKLYQHYTFYCNRVNRTAMPTNESQVTLKNRIQKFKDIFIYVDPNKQQKLLTDIQTLERFL